MRREKRLQKFPKKSLLREIVGVTPVFSEEFIKKNSESTLADSETGDESTDENND